MHCEGKATVDTPAEGGSQNAFPSIEYSNEGAYDLLRSVMWIRDRLS
jgi:hypothetical protein